MSGKMFSHYCMACLVVVSACGLMACADAVDPSRPAAAAPKPMSERLAESGGYKQDETGAWVPKSDKRSAYDSQRESAYFQGKIDKKTYKTGDYARKAWWGTKQYEAKAYTGNTDGSRFQTRAMQDGQISNFNATQASERGLFETNTLKRKSARESRAAEVDRWDNARVEARRKVYKAPSVMDWREQRAMSMDESRGLLGR